MAETRKDSSLERQSDNGSLRVSATCWPSELTGPTRLQSQMTVGLVRQNGSFITVHVRAGRKQYRGEDKDANALNLRENPERWQGHAAGLPPHFPSVLVAIARPKSSPIQSLDGRFQTGADDKIFHALLRDVLSVTIVVSRLLTDPLTESVRQHEQRQRGEARSSTPGDRKWMEVQCTNQEDTFAMLLPVHHLVHHSHTHLWMKWRLQTLV